KNPVKPTADSLARGRRLWAANCATCHGITAESDGPVAKFLTVPNITEDFYKARPDGRIFGVIHNGQNQMPRYGFKFSADEKWDIVNYLRRLQGVAGAGGAE
ncbi:MAG: c-type cytochrome, partial [Bdellovibrionales bacterium]|nr:c-type cytochrome [Bdellovibrionales bacterium]